MKFNDEQMMKFLTLYKQHKCLWDTNLNEYKMKSARSKALKTIVSEMNISYFNIAECKIKIKNVRSHYCQELKKIRESKNEDQVYAYTPSLSWFQTVDSFLKNFVHRNATSLNNNTKDETPIDDSIYIKEEEPFEAIFESFSREDDSNQFQEEVCAPKPKRPKVSEISTVVVETPPIKRTPKLNQSKENEFEVFGKHISMQLSKLSTKQFILAQHEIQAVITRHRLKDYQEQGSLSPNSFEFNDDVTI